LGLTYLETIKDPLQWVAEQFLEKSQQQLFRMNVAKYLSTSTSEVLDRKK